MFNLTCFTLLKFSPAHPLKLNPSVSYQWTWTSSLLKKLPVATFISSMTHGTNHTLRLVRHIIAAYREKKSYLSDLIIFNLPERSNRLEEEQLSLHLKLNEWAPPNAMNPFLLATNIVSITRERTKLQVSYTQLTILKISNNFKESSKSMPFFFVLQQRDYAYFLKYKQLDC